MRSLRVIKLVATVIGLFMLIGLCTFAQPCASDAAMKCNACVSAIKVLIAVYFAIQSIGYVFNMYNLYATIVEFLPILGIVLMLVAIGGCSRADMACQAVTFPFVQYCFIALSIVHAIRVAICIKEARNVKVVAEA